MVEAEKSRSVWDDIDELLEDEDDPSIVLSLPKIPLSSKHSSSSSSSPSSPFSSSSSTAKSPSITVSTSSNTTKTHPPSASVPVPISPTSSTPPIRSLSQRHPLKRSEARLSLPLDDDEEEELKKQIEIQEEQYLLQQEQQKQIQQQQPALSLSRTNSLSPTSIRNNPTPLPRVPSKDGTKHPIHEPSPTTAMKLEKIPSRIADQEKYKSSELHNSYSQLLQLQMMQATQQKKMEQLQALQAHSQMQFITLLSNSSYTSIQTYAPSSSTPELPRISSNNLKPSSSSNNLKSVASSTSLSSPNLKSVASSSSSSSKTLQPSSSSSPQAQPPKSPTMSRSFQTPPPVEISPSSSSQFLIQSPSCRPFPIDSSPPSPRKSHSPALTLQSSTLAVYGGEEDEEEEDDPTWKKLQALNASPPMEVTKQSRVVNVEEAEQDVVRASSDSSLDAILAEINSTLSVK